MNIRPASAQDALPIAEIWNDVIRSSAITFTSEEKSVAGMVDLIETRTVLVAQTENGVVGFATFGPFRDGPGYARVAEHSIYLQPAVQGRGTGTAMLSELEAAARAQGIHHLVAGIGAEAVQSIAFHARQGFDKVAHLPEIGWKFGRSHDLILMQKRLS